MYISFDNDLVCDEKGKLLPEGYDAAKWLVYENDLDTDLNKKALCCSVWVGREKD